MSELSARISKDVAVQGRLQSLAAKCAERLAARYESTAGARAIRELAPSLMLAWLEGYAAHVDDELATTRAEVAAAESESRKVKP